uniref:TauD/TfdA-like domain-containing protein n=1 Tax=Phaeomonas parva TaxID=124430 RepID=A0A7S1TN70_9STRA|mmetsp:Transcript_10194/g.30381  ORF Transcript_10194/g.30381 Transcript_10194/m.30381 type:complete len:279 (+) Transcript_10194:203-1039(+)
MRLLVRLALAGAAVALTIALLRRRSSRGARVGYVSLVAQGLHYWSRPHAGVVPTAPITSRAAWIGAELAQQPELWRHEVTPAEAAALHRAVAAAEATGKAMGMLSAADFPVGAEWLARIAALRRELMHGLGFFVLRGLPVGEWSTAQQELAYWGLGLHLGLPGAQNNEGDLLGHVRDIGGDASTERQYKTRAEVLFHCDAADAVGLLMVQAAKDGGTSRLVSSASVFNRLLRDAPDVAPRLFRPLPMDTRGGGGVDWVRIEPLRVDTAGGGRTLFPHG